MAQRVGRWTCKQDVPGSTAVGALLRNDPGHVVPTLLTLSASSIIRYRSVGGDAVRLGR